jgi:Tfp pilus assembly protein PilF
VLFRSLEESTAQLAQEMDNPEAGLKHLYALSGFGELDEAKDLAEAMENQHAKDAEILFALGAWHEHCKHKADADRCFQAAYLLEPQNPTLIRAQGLTLMEQGQLDEARGLLNVLKPPHPSFDPIVFSTLGKAFQDRQRHAEALELFEIAASVPEMQRSKAFQELVRKSEKAIGRRDTSLVPKLPIWQKKSFKLAAALLLVAGLWSLLTWVRGQNRTLQVINSSPQTLAFAIDGGETLEVFPGSHLSLKVGEGLHKVRIVRPALMAGEKPFAIQTPLWQRAFVSPTCVLDPLQSSLIYWRKVWYREVPDDSKDEADTHYGQLYVQYPGVDYLFADFPAEIRLERRKASSRTGIKFEPLTMQMLRSVESGGAEILRRAEQLLELRGFELPDLLGYYNFCRESKQTDQAKQYLESIRQRRPIVLSVHRLTLGLAQDAAEREKIKTSYDEELKSDPKNPDLLFLRSILETDFSKARPFLEDAIQVAPQHRESVRRMIMGEFCTTNFDQAGKLAEKNFPSLVDFDSVRELMFATKQYALMSRNLQEDPEGFDRIMQATRLFHEMGIGFSDPPRNSEEQFAFQSTFQAAKVVSGGLRVGIDVLAKEELSPSEYWFLETYHAYLDEDVEKIGKLLQSPVANGDETRYWRFIYELENGSQIALLKTAHDMEEAANAEDELLVAIRLRLDGDTEQAETWLKSAADRLAEGEAIERAWSELLFTCNEQTIPADKVRSLMDYPSSKAIYATALAAFSPSVDPALIELAEKCNFDHGLPYRFLRDSLKKLANEK